MKNYNRAVLGTGVIANETAAAMLLRNYDTKWIDKDNATTELKKQEFELRKAISESNNFDLDWEEKNG